MSDAVLERIRPIVGADSVRRGIDGVLRAHPPSADAMAGVLGLAHDQRWRVALQGGGTWIAEPPDADLVVSLRALDEVSSTDAGDGLLELGAGVPLEVARREALERGAWLPLDPPGRPDRTVGSVLATATAGPLRHRFGGVRDLVAAVTIATGDGKLVRATPDEGAELLRLHIGAFGGFGALTSCTLRTAPLPRADATWVAMADRDRLTAAARHLANHRVTAVACELFSPALATDGEWVLALRLVGTRDAVLAGARQVAELSALDWSELSPERHILLWNGTARAVTIAPVTLRLGVLSEGVDEAIDLVIARLGEGMLSAGPASGGLRWSGDAEAEVLRELRGELAGREIPLTLERAPHALARAVGLLGGYREGGGATVARLRAVHDPHAVLAVPLDAETAA